MALKDIFKMTKANRYTADGREELIKAQEAVTEDRRYNIGEISEKTGLQKTANGWVKPKGGAERNHGTEQKKRGPGAIHTPGKGNFGMDKMKEAAEKGLKGQELKEFMTGSKSESKPAAGSKKIDYQVTEKGGKFYATGHQFSDGSQLHAGPFGSEKELHEFMNGSPYKSTAESKPAESTSSAPKTESTPEQKNMLDYFKTVKEKVNSEGKGSVPLRDFKKASEIQMAINKYNDWKAGRLTRRGGPDGILEGEELGKALKNDIERLGLNPSDVIGDSAPRVLTGDTRIRVRK